MLSMGGILLATSCWIFITLYQSVQVYGGFACLSNPCVHGVCLDDLNSTYSCYCIDGYTGVQCQTNWDECWSNPCQNGGVCLDAIASFNCSCPDGFAGDVCEEDFNECESNPCSNNGTCVDGHNGYACSCLPGYAGIHCEEDVAVCNVSSETRCQNGGMCVEGPGVTFTCKCPSGWTGFLCDVEIDECMSDPCENGAVCIDMQADYACACLFGFTGRNCEEVVLVCADNPCQNDALCLMEEDRPVCYCVPDYHGEKCQFQYDECQLGPRCMNGGTCIDGVDNFTCSCPPSLTGVLCECLIVDDVYLDCTYIITSTTTQAYFTTTTQEMSTTEPTTLTSTTEGSVTTSTTESTTESTVETTTLSTTEDATSVASTTIELTSFVPNFTSEFVTTTLEITTETTSDYPITSTTFSNVPNITIDITTTGTFDSTTELLTTMSSTTFELSTPSTVITTSTIMPQTTEQLTTYETSETTDFTTFTMSSATTEFTNATKTGRDVDETTSELTTMSSFFTDTPYTSTANTESTTEYSTTEYSSTISYFPDCSKWESRCLNGGSCVLSNDMYRCICPFDTEGFLCEHHMGIKTAAFSGGSYLSHILHEKSRMAIDFKAKTTSNSGLLFYSYIDQTYMTLFIEGGYLKFKFSCGYQTMLLSELGKPVNNGYEMRINAELRFSKDFRHCNASIKLNNTLSMSGDQIALIDKFSKTNSKVYLGGVPSEYVKDRSYPGFVGCMSSLKISGKSTNIFKDAQDGFGITECSSLACLSNPCQNSGGCVSDGDSWICHCKNGFSGKMCEVSMCDTNPCHFGGTCLPYTGSGYICLCPYGKHGHFCENELQISKPYFSSSIHGFSSYVAYPIPTGKFNRMEIKFKFSPTTMDQISILMFIGQKGRHDYHSDHMAVSFVKGYIMLTWNLGSGPRRIFTTHPIPPGKLSYTVHVGRLARRSWLYVESLGNVTGRSPGNLIHLDVVPLIYFGGYDTQNFSTLPHDLPLHTGFSGCIFDVEFRARDIIIPLESSTHAVGRALGQCETTECHDKICQNDGACLYHGGTFTCLCQDGNYGPLCSARHNLCDSTIHNCSSGATCVSMIAHYECDCPLGKVGKYCEKEELLTDISFTGVRSYVAVPPKELESTKFNIEFEIRPLKNKGLVLFFGRLDTFISVSLISGLLELRILPLRKKLHANEIVVIRSNKLIVLGSWHKIRLMVYGRKIYLFVNNVVNTGVLQAGEVLSLSDDDILIGGSPDLSTLPSSALSFLPVPFTGCFRKFLINNKHISLNSSYIKTARNIADCDGTPCGGDLCENSGTCWLDPNLKPHCSCPDPFYGERCENIPNCFEISCQNNGKCFHGKCICSVGWRGAFCETSIIVRTPKFEGTSFMVINKVQKKRATSSVKSVYLNFTTATEDGIIFWTQKSSAFVGIGLEKGLLKIAYTSSNFHKNIEVPDIGRISDGFYHSVDLSFNPFYLKVDSNDIDILNNNQVKGDHVSLYDNFYLGGVPMQSASHREARNIFHGYFEGCIQAFGANKDFLITDFSEFEGENIDSCSIN